MGIGIDGSRACDAFGAGKPTGFRGTMWLNSENHGATAVKLLVASIKDGSDTAGADLHRSGVHQRREFRHDYKAKLCK